MTTPDPLLTLLTQLCDGCSRPATMRARRVSGPWWWRRRGRWLWSCKQCGPDLMIPTHRR